jgi:hypothetical protein
MPSKDAHLKKAHHNESFVQDLDVGKTSYKDWAVVGLFYAALHYLDAYLAQKNTHPISHEGRDGWIKNLTELYSIYKDYRELKEYRMDVSYKLIEYTEAEINRDIKPHLRSIKAQLNRLESSIV